MRTRYGEPKTAYKMKDEDFLIVEDHFAALVLTLEPEEMELYNRTRHVRVETGYRDRNFVVYQMRGGKRNVLDHISVLDFRCDDEIGASIEIKSNENQDTLVVGYIPIRLFGFDAFVHLPLHGRLSWSTTPDKVLEGKLGFPVCIRTLSRRGLREEGITYCETGMSYAREFESARA